MSDRRPLASTAVTLMAVAVLLAGCSTPSSPAATSTGGGDGGTSPSSASSAPAAASGPDACALVTASILQTALGSTPGSGVSSAGHEEAGSSTCTYSDGTVVQLTAQADSYLPASIYSPSGVAGAVAPTSGDRGYVATEAVLVVKGQTGVFVTYTHEASLDQGQALAAAIVAGL